MPTVADPSPLHTVIRPQLWIHWSVFALCVICWAGMLYVGELTERTDVGLKSVLGLRSGEIARFFSTLMLLWAGQLALLIYWYRRKSRNDFQGRYRVWLWIGVTLQFLLAIVATEGHVSFREYMHRVWPMPVPRYDLLCWLVPVATISLAMFRMLGMETRNSTCSRVLLWMAGISGVIAAASFVIGPLLPQRACDLLQVGSATLAHLGLATALLFHARYVIHVNNEAPPKTGKATVTQRLYAMLRSLAVASGSGIRWPRLSPPKLRRPRVQRPQRKSRQQRKPQASDRPQAAKASKRPVAPSASTAKVGTPGKPQKAPPSTTTASANTGEQRHIHRSELPKGPKTSMQPSLSELAARVENGETLGDDDLSGLNKKQRRRLRQLEREANRTVASAQ